MQFPKSSIDPQTLNKLKKVDHLGQYLSTVNQQRRNIQYFQLISHQKNVTYLDQLKQFALVRVKYLQKLQEISQKNRKDLNKIEQQIKQQHYDKTAFNKIIDFKNQEIQYYKQQIQIAKRKIEEFQKGVKINEELLSQKQKYIKVLMEKYEEQLEKSKKYHDTNKEKSSHSDGQNRQQKSVQTNIDLKLIQNQNNKKGQPHLEQASREQNQIMRSIQSSLSHQEVLAKKYQEEIKKLKLNFEHVLENISQQTQNKLLQMSQQKLGIEKWIQENNNLRNQNAQLREQIKNINQQQEKIKIWKSTLQDYVGKVDKDYMQQVKMIDSSLLENKQNLQRSEKSQKQRNQQTELKNLKDEKIKLMQATIDRLQIEQRQKQNKLQEIKKLMDSTQESSISEQNIVGNLLALSAKVKQVVKFLLEQL